MARCCRWLQLRRFAPFDFGLVKSSRDKENTGKIVSRYEEERVEFNRLPGLRLGFLNLAGVNKDTRQEVVSGRICRRECLRVSEFGQAFRKFPLDKKLMPTQSRMRL